MAVLCKNSTQLGMWLGGDLTTSPILPYNPNTVVTQSGLPPKSNGFFRSQCE